MIGRQSGFNNLSDGIVAIGNYAGFNNISNIKNTYLGTNSGYNSKTGDGNTFLGNKSGYSTLESSSAFNTAIGNEAGYSLTSGARNVLIGSTTSSNGVSNDSAGWSLSSGNDNVHIGVSAGNKATSAINNVLIGSIAGTSITTASNNVLIGENAGNTLSTSGQNVIIGTNAANVYNAGNGLIVGYNAGTGYTGAEAFTIGYNSGSNVSGDYNMFVGYNSGGLTKVNTTGAYNIAIGPYTGFNLSSGTRNVILGSGDSSGSTGKLINTGSDNTLMGYKSGSALQAGSGNSLFGSNAGASITSGVDNLVLGYQTAFKLNSGSYNVVLGPQAGYNLNSGQSNIYSGFQAGYNNQTGSYNINMGYKSGYSSIGNNYNIHIGHNTGYKSVADNNLFLGYQSGLNNTYGTNNIFIGSESGAGVNANSEQTGTNNIFLGTKAGYGNNNGYSNIFMGANSGKNSLDGTKNIFIGENAGSSSTTSHNIFIGNSSSNTSGVGYLSTGIGQNNVFIGSDVGIANTIGNKNIFLGDQAGMHNVAGVENIYIGTNAGQNANSTAANYNIAIGSDAGINNQSGTENILIGRQVAGLATSTNYNQNIIIGTDAGQNIRQNNQIFIGTNAGQINTTGDRNIFMGLNAGKSNITSADNVIIGSDAGTALRGIDGIGDNVLIGAQAGQVLETGTNNIYIGSGAGTNAITSINNVVIGAKAMNQGNADDVVIIGNNAGLNNQTDANIFIGSNAGVQNTTGLGNIFVGHESGYNVNSNGNIIFGNKTVSTGKVSDNNIIVGNETAQNVVNKTNFANNIIMGPNAGKSSSLSINSIILGSNAVNTGTGGEANIIMGNDTAIKLGNFNPYYGTISSVITINSNYVYINIPFGSGGYYFKTNDFIIIESLINNYVFQTQIIVIKSGTGSNMNKTQIIFNTKSTETIPIGSIIYVKNVKINSVGKNDFSKSSSNMCIGDHNGFGLTSGSKNASIGDNAMYNNKVGKYNITFGTESGYNINTDNNLCLGIQAGYSIDKYKNNAVVNNITFNKDTNSVSSNNIDLTNLYYGTVIEIDGSSDNDNRYYVNGTANNAVIVQGYPNIFEVGLPPSALSTYYTINASKFYFTNYTFTSDNVNNYINIYELDISGIPIINIQFNNSTDATNLFNIIRYISHFEIQNSKFNDGIKIVNSYSKTGITLNGNSIIIYTIQPLYMEKYGDTLITLKINNISFNADISKNGFTTNIFSNDALNVQFGLYKGSYNVSQNLPYFSSEPNLNIKGTIVDKQLYNGVVSDNINKIYIKGNTSSITDIKSIISKYTYTAFTSITSNNIIFNQTTNTIENISNLILTTGLYLISGTTYNNGYYYIDSFNTQTTINNALVNPTYPLINETIDISVQGQNIISFKYAEISNANFFGDFFKSDTSFKGNIIKVKYRNDYYLNYAMGAYVLEHYNKNYLALDNNLLNFNKQNIITNTNDISFNEAFNTINSTITNLNLFNIGDIITLSNCTNANNNTTFKVSSIITNIISLDKDYKKIAVGSGGTIQSFIFTITGPLNNSFNITLCDNNIKVINSNISNPNNYLSSNDLIFQTSNIELNNITFYSSNSTITTNIDYEFVDIVAPVIIKIENSTYNNNFYLVTTNDIPYNKLQIDNTFNIITDETSTITIKTNCISSYINTLDLGTLDFNKEYITYGSKNNDNVKFKLYNDIHAKSNVSIYLSNDSIINNDSYNDVYYSIKTQPNDIISLNTGPMSTTNLQSFIFGYSSDGFYGNNHYANLIYLSSKSFALFDNPSSADVPYMQNSYITLTDSKNLYSGTYFVTNVSGSGSNRIITVSDYYSPSESPSNIKLVHFNTNDYPYPQKFKIDIIIYQIKSTTNMNDIVNSINKNALLVLKTAFGSTIDSSKIDNSYYISNIVNDSRQFCISLIPTITGGITIQSFDNLIINNVETNLIKGIFQNYEFNNSNITVASGNDISFNINTVVLPLNINAPNGYVKILNTPSNQYDGLYFYNYIVITTNTINLSLGTQYMQLNTNYTSSLSLPIGLIINNCNVLFNQFVITNSINDSINLNNMVTKLQDNFKYISFKRKYEDPLSLVNDNNNLTFKNDGMILNTGTYSLSYNNILSLEENCPNDTNVYSYIIDFGTPNPITKPSNIYRKKKRPIIYSKKSFSITSNLTVDFFTSPLLILISSNITISPNLNIIPNSNYSYNQYYGKTFAIDNFKMFKKNQIIKLENYLPFSAGNFNGILKINDISQDLNTIYCVPVLNNANLNSTIFQSPYTQSYNGIAFNIENILNDVGMNFTYFNNNWNNIGVMGNFSKLCIALYKNSSDYSSTDTSIYSNSELYFTDLYTGQPNNLSKSQLLFTNNKSRTNLKELCMNNTLIIPLDNISTNYTNISFHNISIVGSSDISFYSSNNTITSITTDLSTFIISEYILVSNTINNNNLFRINDSIVPTSNSIIISNTYTLINENNKSATIRANNINTSNSSITDLSIFKGGQTLIISQTIYNNTAYVSNIDVNSKYSIYIDSKDVITEIPDYCSIENSMIKDETSIVSGSSNINFDNNQITLSDNNDDLSIFRPKQKLQITNSTANNSNFTVSESIVPSNVSITIDETLNVENNSSAIISKTINFNIIGQPIEVKYTANYSDLYNYEDAQGNNAMVGSFAGQFSGELTYSIYNLYLGSRCAQVNHGSGNIFIGNEGKNALTASESGSSTYSNKFAIYKNNFVGVSSQPLIGGDFTTGRVGINTITPENFNTSTDVTITDTKLVVNGGVVANSYSPFTGCHIVKFANSNIVTNIKEGMIVSSTGIINKQNIITTFCTVDLSKVENDKTVFGIYAFSEETKSSSETEYIINSDGKYVKNPLYNTKMVTLHYVASLGEGCILVSNYGGEIQNGDYITTCPIENGGYGSLQSDDILRSYTVAKCTETINWSSIPETISYDGNMYKVYLAGCTYHCG